MDYTVHGILQARILEWVGFPFSKGSSQPRDQTQVSCTGWESNESQRWQTLSSYQLAINEQAIQGSGKKKNQHSNYYVNILVHMEGKRYYFCYEQHYLNTTLHWSSLV